MTTKNDVTGDSMVSKETTDVYRNNWDAIFGKPRGKTFGKAGEMSMERYENAYKKLGESK